MSVSHFTFRSSILGMEARVLVILPEQQENPCAFEDGKKYQTLYLTHGGGADCTEYLRCTQIEMFTAERNLAVVCPEVGYCYYCDQVHGKKWFTYLTEELPGVVETIFPITSDPAHRFVAGVSMGAHGAFKWALNKPEFFAAVGGFSGACDFAELQKTVRPDYREEDRNYINAAFGKLSNYYNSVDDITMLAEKLYREEKPMPSLYTACGTEDFCYEECKRFKERADSIGLPLVFEEGPGAHDFRYWNPVLERFLDWLPLVPGLLDW